MQFCIVFHTVFQITILILIKIVKKKKFKVKFMFAFKFLLCPLQLFLCSTGYHLGLRGKVLVMGSCRSGSVSRAQCCHTSVRSSPSCSSTDPLLTEPSCEWCWLCCGLADCRKGKTAEQQQRGECSERMFNGPTGTHISAGGAPGMKQQLPASQERPTEEQPLFSSPLGCSGGKEKRVDGRKVILACF